jgi:DinB superfamily
VSIEELAKEYKASTDEFLALVSTVKSSELDKSASDGWNPRQVIHHLADSEAQSYARLRRLIAEPGTIIQGYDEGLWAENSTLGYRTRDIASSLAVFTAVRQSSYELICAMNESQLDLQGTHTESGAYTVRDWLRSYTKHPRDHAEQIREQLRS